MIYICFAMLESKYYVLVLFRKSDMWSCKIKAFEGKVCVLSNDVYKFF